MMYVRGYILFNEDMGERKAAEKDVHLMKGPWDKSK